MKIFLKSTFLIVFLIIAVAGFSQADSFSYNGKTIEIDNRLIDHYGQDYISTLKSNDPNSLLYFNYLIKNAYKVEDIGEKISSAENFNLIKSSKSNTTSFDPNNPSSFNFLSYGGVMSQEQKVYKTGKGSEAIIILSKANFLKAFNSYKADLQK